MHHNRPIMANFRDYGNVELIMKNVSRLRNTHFSVDYDFPREIQEARGRLWPKYKALKQQNPRSKVHILYPAKLIKDGTIIQDELPEWGKYIGANRLVNLRKISAVHPAHILGKTNSRTDWTASANQYSFDKPAVPTFGVDCAVSMPAKPQPLPPATDAMDFPGNEASTEAAVHIPSVITPEVTQTFTLSTDKTPSNQSQHLVHAPHVPTVINPEVTQTSILSYVQSPQQSWSAPGTGCV
ncbi:hypothetical protein DPMN_016979 [Dreissena polymorpha]|uniref:Uncharacterized protein n=1 Tax=Dreissena polymorpha TaxID=45954 RepID=A0A9D4S5Z3_DREPO|nr:hypothetical protein DPMN_016979 [Dreissena polymorpha]